MARHTKFEIGQSTFRHDLGEFHKINHELEKFLKNYPELLEN